MTTFSGFKLIIGLLGCLSAEKVAKADFVEIVTPESSLSTGADGISPATTTVKTAVVTPATTTTAKPSPVYRVPTKNKAFEWPSNDTYVQAYVSLHRKAPAKRNDQYGPQDNSYNTVIRSSPIPEHKYPSLTQDEGSGWTSSPRPFYLPAPTMYHPPSYHHYEEFHSPHWHNKPYSSSSSSSSLLFGLLPKKLSLKLLFKIILKLVLFKMIVKFIAVICLLLFIPLLKSKDHSHDGMMDDDLKKMRRLNEVSNIIWNSIIDKEKEYSENDISNEKEEEEELKLIKKIADLASADPPAIPGARAVIFLRRCVSLVERIASGMLRHLKRREQDPQETWLAVIMKRMKSMLEMF